MPRVAYALHHTVPQSPWIKDTGATAVHRLATAQGFEQILHIHSDRCASESLSVSFHEHANAGVKVACTGHEERVQYLHLIAKSISLTRLFAPQCMCNTLMHNKFQFTLQIVASNLQGLDSHEKLRRGFSAPLARTAFYGGAIMPVMNLCNPNPTGRSLADYTRRDLLISQISGQSAIEVMCELLLALHLESQPNLLSGCLDLLHCELLTSLTLRYGLVTVRVSLPGTTVPLFVLGRSVNSLAWRARELEPVEFVVLCIKSSTGGLEDGQVLAAIDRLSKDQNRLNELRKAPDAETILSVLSQLPIIDAAPGLTFRQEAALPILHSKISLGAFGQREKTRSHRKLLGA